MSALDLLSGLTTYDNTGRQMKVWRGQFVKADDVREALRNPTDEQVAALRPVVYAALADAGIPATMDREGFVARAVLAAAAGSDDERA